MRGPRVSTIQRVSVLCLSALLASTCLAQEGRSSSSTGTQTLFPDAGSGDHLATLTPYAQITGVYDLSNTLTSNNLDGNLTRYDATGIMVSAGVDGYHSWERTVLGLSVRGSYHNRLKSAIPDSNSEFITLGLQHKLSPHVTVSLTQVGGSSNLALSTAAFGMSSSTLLPGLTNVDQSMGSLPTSELFDGRVYFSSTSSMLSYQRSARNTLYGGGGGFVVRRDQSGAPGVSGANALGGTSYQVSRRQTLSLQYAFTRYNYTGVFGNADSQMAGVGYGVILNPRWKFSLMGGAYRVRRLQTIRVALDPAVALMLGQQSTSEVQQGVTYFGGGTARLEGNFRRSNIAFQYVRTSSAGNNIFLASRLDNAATTYSYSLLRRCSVLLTGGYMHMATLGRNYQPLQQVVATGAVSYRLHSPFYLTATFSKRHMLLDYTGRRPDTTLAMIGFGFSPNGVPLW